MTARLSALVVAHNEEARLAECLERLRFADEIVVVLDRSTDRSEEIARRFTDRILIGAWEIEGDRRNAGIEFCRGPWVLEVDADERVGEALAHEIAETARSSRHDIHEIPVDNYVGDRLVRWGWGASFGRSAYAGLFRKGSKSWAHERVHPKLMFIGGKGPRLKNPIQHYVDRDISDMLGRLNRYSSLRAMDLRASGDPGSFAHNVRRIFSRFWKCYVARRGYREGGYGFVIATCAALYPILSYLKATLEKAPLEKDGR
ncbi:MAG: glycosyltransferase family 2 protein [Rhodospirillales bacterium]